MLNLLALTAADVTWGVLAALAAFISSLSRTVWKLSNRVTRLEALEEERHDRRREHDRK